MFWICQHKALQGSTHSTTSTNSSSRTTTISPTSSRVQWRTSLCFIGVRWPRPTGLITTLHPTLCVLSTSLRTHNHAPHGFPEEDSAMWVNDQRAIVEHDQLYRSRLSNRTHMHTLLSVYAYFLRWSKELGSKVVWLTPMESLLTTGWHKFVLAIVFLHRLCVLFVGLPFPYAVYSGECIGLDRNQ